jgi:glutamine synthetase
VGDQLTRVLDSLEKGEKGSAATLERISLGIRNLPEVAKDNTDRNRTSPFAFTGNKFEFRAVSSAASISGPIAFLNAAVGEALAEFEAAISSRTAKGASLPDAALEVVRQAVSDTKAVRYEGNNYAPELVEEAQRRGLPNLRATPEALAELIKPEARAFLAKARMFSEGESEARYHVKLERYIKDIEIEVEALTNLINGHVLPAAYRQLGLLAAAGSSRIAKEDRERLDDAVDTLAARVKSLEAAVERSAPEVPEKRAHLLAQEVVPGMAAVREVADRIEEMVADDFWTLPKYSEMLFLV